jgi:hypothetical protein
MKSAYSLGRTSIAGWTSNAVLWLESQALQAPTRPRGRPLLHTFKCKHLQQWHPQELAWLPQLVAARNEQASTASVQEASPRSLATSRMGASGALSVAPAGSLVS